MVRFQKFLIARYRSPSTAIQRSPATSAGSGVTRPYQNVRLGVNLPETLVVAGEYDSRVRVRCTPRSSSLPCENNPGQVSPFLGCTMADFDSGHGTGRVPTSSRAVDRDYERKRSLMRALGMIDSTKTAARRNPELRTQRRKPRVPCERAATSGAAAKTLLPPGPRRRRRRPQSSTRVEELRTPAAIGDPRQLCVSGVNLQHISGWRPNRFRSRIRARRRPRTRRRRRPEPLTPQS